MSVIRENAEPKQEAQAFVVREYPDDMLKAVAQPWLKPIVEPEFQDLLDSLEATVKLYRALGISGPQVGIPFRVISVMVAGAPLTMINPVVTAVAGDSVFGIEGCLSFPGLALKVKRSQSAGVRFMDRQGVEQSRWFSGAEARAILHELDHLCGITFLDRIPKVLRSDAMRKWRLAPRVAKQNNKRLQAMLKKFEALQAPAPKTNPNAVSIPSLTTPGEPVTIDAGGVLTAEVIEAAAKRVSDECGT